MNANKQQFDSAGNNCGTIADHIRAASDLLEIDYTLGEINIFGEAETQESISETIASNRLKAQLILTKCIKALAE